MRLVSPQRRVVELPITSDTPLGTLLRREELNKDNTNAAVEVVFQIGSRDRKDKVGVAAVAELCRLSSAANDEPSPRLTYTIL